MLSVWFLAFLGARDALYRLHARWFRLSPEQFDALHYAGMAGYKLCIFLFHLMPCIALHVVG
jgi:hypothetical protein